jgi:excinuclease UvrABC nuclease subunit
MRNKYISRNNIGKVLPYSGIYWLFTNNSGFLDLVYVGQTVNLRERLRQHSHMYQFEFFTFEYCIASALRQKERRILEDYYLRIGHLPKFNSQLG